MNLSLRNQSSFLLFMVLIASCKSKTEETAEVPSGTPVTITTVNKITMAETVTLNATSSFLLKTPVRSVANGYLQHVKIRQCDFVNRGETLMSLVTKEAQTIGSTISKIDTSFHFKGEIAITAPGSGYISQLNFQSGDYVQDGEQVATISDDKSFAFILELPYELTPLLKSNKSVDVILPDSTRLHGTVDKPMPTVDAASQTQSYLVSVDVKKMIPENLVAKVLLMKSSHPDAVAVPKAAVLTDETQSSFWVMKLLNDTTAVKVTIQKGIESSGQVEILSPPFSATDRILISGNYGLPDTAHVHIQK